MAFKKSNIMFDEKPKKGSKNAITSDAVSKMGGGIPLYCLDFYGIQTNIGVSGTSTDCYYAFEDSDKANDFLNNHVVIGAYIKDIKNYSTHETIENTLKNSWLSTKPLTFKTNSSGISRRVDIPCMIHSTSTFSGSFETTVTAVFVKKSDLTNFTS